MASRNRDVFDIVNAAFEKGDTEGFLAHCTDDLVWNMVGDRTVTGKQAIREWMKSMEQGEPPSFTTETVIAEGDDVAATGQMTMKAKDGAVERYTYCDVYRFTNGTISALKSFVIKEKP